MTGEQFALSYSGEWPRCYHDETKFCGDRATGETELVARGWHVADMCDIPSCPLRCAISGLHFQLTRAWQ